MDFKVSNDVGSGGGGKLAGEGGDAEGRAGMQRRVGIQSGGQGCIVKTNFLSSGVRRSRRMV